MKNSSWIISLIVGLGAGFLIGRQSPPTEAARVAVAAPTPAPAPSQPAKPSRPSDDPNLVYKVPIEESPMRGQQTAKVTIIEFSDFECPFCSRATNTMDEVRKSYGDDVRIVFKQNPLPFHSHAMPAAKAAIAAQKQGKFWELHDKMFANQKALDMGQIEGYAKEAGLDIAKWKADMESPAVAAQIDKEMKLAAQLGATGTPAFFINGKKVVGAQPLERFKQVIDAEKAEAEKRLASGVAATGLYEALVGNGVSAPPAAPAQPQQQAPAPSAKKVEFAKYNPSKGPAAAPVTIVMWSDFQCPFCSRVEPTMKQILESYPNKVKIVWRNEPLPFHQDARPAAKAAMAAHKQGKFWEMHEKMFANQKALGADALEGYAKEIGLDLAKWKSDMSSNEIEQQIADDEKVGQAVGANGTPTFFINGKELGGAQPLQSFKAIIDEQLTKADELAKKGVKVEEMYEKLTAANIAAAPSMPSPVAIADAPVQVDLGDAPVKGVKNAPITIIEFSDFECPFCSRGANTLAEVEKAYGDKVRVAFKNNPLPFHQHAQLAAEAALAAGEQGKFWEMHDKLFANQRALGREDLEKYATELGLDASKFKAALDSGKYKAKVEADLKQGGAAGVSGTPTFVINGTKVVGAQPFEKFKQVIDEQLAKKK